MDVRKVHRSGHSLVIGLPASVCDEAEIRNGDHLAVMVKQKGQIVMHKMKLRTAEGWVDPGENITFAEGDDDNGKSGAEN